ncbi:MAG: hypothetical protein K5765_08135 [Clostridia bacterium]|nr:hypothetical protein [Clostridia bacterium]
MINTQMRDLINSRKALDPNYGEGIQAYWDKELEVLKVSLEETINYINTAPKEEICFCSEIWEDLSEYWQSKELINAMENCKKRLPEIADDISVDIEYAKKALK